MDFDQFFRTAFGKDITAFDYQRRLAEETECKSCLINVPTFFDRIAVTGAASGNVLMKVWTALAIRDWRTKTQLKTTPQQVC